MVKGSSNKDVHWFSKLVKGVSILCMCALGVHTAMMLAPILPPFTYCDADVHYIFILDTYLKKLILQMEFNY